MTDRPDLDAVLAWRGRRVHDPQGERLGTLGALYLDDASGLPAYGGVTTGLFGRHESLLPLTGMAEEEEDGLRTPFAADLVRDAPKLDPDAVLTDEEQDALAAHYALRPEPGELIRSEEEVEVGVSAPRPAERVRLRKVLVTEHVQVREPRRREVVQLETEPAPEGRIESVEPVDDERR